MLIFAAGCESDPAAAPEQKPVPLDALYPQGLIKFDTGDLPGAIKIAEQGISQASGNPEWNWKFKILEAETFLWQRENTKALRLLEGELPPALVHGQFELRTRLIQGRALSSNHDYKNAALRLKQARALVPAAPDLSGHVALAEASLLFNQHQYQKERQKLRRAGELAFKYDNKELQARVLGTWGRLYTQTGHYDPSIDALQASLAISDAIGARHISAATKLNIGWNYLEMGDVDGSETFFDDALKFSKVAALRNVEENSLNNLGRVNLFQADYRAANNYFQQALDRAKAMNEYPAMADALDNLARVALETGQLDEAEKYNDQALQIAHGNEKKINGDENAVPRFPYLLTAATIADAKGQYPKAERLLRQVMGNPLTSKPVEAEAEGELANFYVLTKHTAKADTQFRRALKVFDAVRASIKEVQNRLAFSGREVEFYTDYIRFLSSHKRQATALGIAEFMRARTLEEGLRRERPIEPADAPVRQIQAFLKKNKQIIFSYWLAPARSFLWVITPSAFRQFELPGKREIELKVEEYRRGLLGTPEGHQVEDLGRDLYKILIEPAKAFVPPGSRIIVIPDGRLGRLSFETLVGAGPGVRYWIEDAEIEYGSSIALVIRSKEARLRGNEKVLIMGNPTEASKAFPELKNTGKEVDRVGAHFSPEQKTVISRENATPAAYKSSHPEQFGVVHLATHGTASSLRPLDSAIILSLDADKSFKLYARDIVKFPLRAQLVTLSACSGAGTKTYSAEGPVGLAWAFMRAGAHQVIAGLWDVDDYSTPKYMDYFYTELKAGKTASQALRIAKMNMLHSRDIIRFPKYWATLQLYIGS